MEALAGLLAVAMFVVVLAIVTAPLRAHLVAGERHRRARPGDEEALRRLEAEREARYRELRDAELDYRTGKLRGEDYAVIRESLRREALAVLDAIEATKARIEGDRSPAEAQRVRSEGDRSAQAAKAASAESGEGSSPASPTARRSADLQQRDRVAEEKHREEDRPAVEVALDERAAAERPAAAADAESA
jgi:hypothetical protein